VTTYEDLTPEQKAVYIEAADAAHSAADTVFRKAGITIDKRFKFMKAVWHLASTPLPGYDAEPVWCGYKEGML